jgi:hypothetical protein
MKYKTPFLKLKTKARHGAMYINQFYLAGKYTPPKW